LVTHHHSEDRSTFFEERHRVPPKPAAQPEYTAIKPKKQFGAALAHHPYRFVSLDLSRFGLFFGAHFLRLPARDHVESVGSCQAIAR
jgi:hypothetical protein